MKEDIKNNISISKFVYQNKILAFFTHWLFQGILYADKTEKTFRILIDIVLTIIFFLVFINFINYQISIVLSWFISHTLNAIINGQIFVVIRNYKTKRNKQDFTDYAKLLKKRILEEKSINAAAIYGSYCRGEVSESSDLDVRIIRKHGFINGLRSCFFGLTERTRALLKKFPIDLYILDGTKHLTSKIREDEKPIVLYDSEGILKKLYGKIYYLDNGFQ